MLHTTIDKARGTLPIDAIETELLPEADYYALGHLHIDFQYNNFVYPGPLFPNNFQELEDLQYGSFYIIDTESGNPLKKIEIKLKEVIPMQIKIKNALTATEQIVAELEKIEIALSQLSSRIRFLQEKKKEIIHDLAEFKDLIVHPKELGVVLVIKYNKEYQKEKLIEYCNSHHLPFTLCPRYIRLNHPAICIEIKQLK